MSAVIAECCVLRELRAAVFTENDCLRRLHCAVQRIADRVSNQTSNTAADTGHRTNADAESGQPAGSFIFCCILRHVETAFLLIGISLIRDAAAECEIAETDKMHGPFDTVRKLLSICHNPITARSCTKK